MVFVIAIFAFGSRLADSDHSEFRKGGKLRKREGSGLLLLFFAPLTLLLSRGAMCGEETE